MNKTSIFFKNLEVFIIFVFMSRTKKHPYTKAKAISTHCRNSSGKCSYCVGNRTYKNKKRMIKVIEDAI